MKNKFFKLKVQKITTKKNGFQEDAYRPQQWPYLRRGVPGPGVYLVPWGVPGPEGVGPGGGVPGTGGCT